MTTSRISNYRIVEIVKQTAKTSIVRELTSYSNDTFRVKNNQLTSDEFTPLNEETAKTATLILNINNPEWGVKRFNYRSEHGNIHSFGTGSNSAILFDDNFKFWRVIK